MVLPWSSTLDVSYVGSHNFNSVSFGAIPIPTGELSDGPECAGHRDGVSPAVPGPDAGDEHDPRRDGV